MFRFVSAFAKIGCGALAFFLTLQTSVQAAQFRVINNGSHTIVSAFVTDGGAPYWGSDLLGSDYLFSGYFLSTAATGCAADIRLLYDDGTVATKYGFDSCDYNYVSNY